MLKTKEAVLPKFKVFETDQFISDIENLPKNIKGKLFTKIQKLVYFQIAENPYYGGNIKKLKDYSPETWRFRFGNYRMFYEIDYAERIIFIIALKQRKDAY